MKRIVAGNPRLRKRLGLVHNSRLIKGRIDEIRPLILLELGGGFLAPFLNAVFRVDFSVNDLVNGGSADTLGLVASSLPKSFAVPVAWGGLLAVVTALVAVTASRLEMPC